MCHQCVSQDRPIFHLESIPEKEFCFALAISGMQQVLNNLGLIDPKGFR
jgi:hypothetical protein